MTYDTYQRLSFKTFFIMLAERSLIPITISFVWIGLVFIKTLDINFLSSVTNSQDIAVFATKILDLTLVLGVAIILFAWLTTIFGALLEHMTFYFMLNEHGISIKQGLIHKKETTTPYRHIENTNLDQSLLYQLIGMCRLHIITGEEGDNNNHGHQTEIEFPIIEKTLAEEIKKQIFSKSNIQIVNTEVK